ncbi:hypothetical protein GALMADRAFT_404872 [Galerina marginata CBS 339.88]|uniref:Uncharacterized protein n=1 Tax=Galerina marginata (strain CBS 339.88) TaxID=685588 RepID=A0A067T2K5_GALM3|nr:hypothetical protein GALMADRAFT_404872 [Galerina marginata CBS 339.88]
MENHNKRVTRSMNRKSQKGSSSTSSKPLSTTRPSMPGKRKLGARLGEGADGPVEANAKSFPIFPDELLLEIMSYYPKPRDLVSSEATEYQTGHAIENATRRHTLLALSQSCRSLRWYLRPYIWSRIEVCPGTLDEFSEGRRKSEIAISRMYNEELVRQLEMVTVRDPSLAKLVKLINVEVTDFSIASVLLELARCMTLFPNLHVVKLGISPSTPSTSYNNPLYKSAKRAISGYSYPQIEVVSLSQAAYPLLFCCPNLRSVDRMDKYSVFHGDIGFLRYVIVFCPLLESLTFNMATASSGVEGLCFILLHFDLN